MTTDLTSVRDVAEWLAAQPPRQLTGQQLAALSFADKSLSPEERQEFSDLWRAHQGSPAAPAPTNPLQGVPYYPQRDSATGQGVRMCFSSSCAMLLEAVKPGTLQGPNGDDQYLAVVQRFGDTTDPVAQVRALGSFGVQARKIETADFQLIEQQIARGFPVPCGYLHRGRIDWPQGGGHWLCVYGIDRSHVTVHDPWGEPDLISGTTLSSNGRGLRFSRENFGRRWMVEQVAGGGYRYAPGNGWAVVVDSVG